MKTFLKTTGWLVMAAALTFGITACSSDDANELPANQTQPKEQVYTLVIKASKGGDADTRALRTGSSGIDAYWSGTETFDVVIYDSELRKLKKIGTGTADASETVETTITATLSETPSGELYFYLHGAVQDYTGQVGLLTGTNSISEKYDYNYAQLTTSQYTLNGDEIVPNDGVTLTFNPQTAIVKFTLLDKDTNEPINPTSLTIHDYSNWLTQSRDAINDPERPVKGDITITPSGSTNEIYVALAGVGDSKLRLTATVGDDTYIYKKTDVTFEGGEYYTRTVKMTKCQAPAPSLSTLTIGSATIYYNSGETWAEAIANHPLANYDWYLSKDGTGNYRVYWNSSYLLGEGWQKVYSTSAINPEVSYSLSE